MAFLNMTTHIFENGTKINLLPVFRGLFSLSLCFPVEFSLFSYNNGMVMSSCREMDNNRSALSAASAFAIATAGANEGTPTKEKYRRMSLASTGTHTDPFLHRAWGLVSFPVLQHRPMSGSVYSNLRFYGFFKFSFSLLLKLFVSSWWELSIKTSPNTSSAGFPTDQRNGDKEFVIRRAATNRVLNVLRHWVSKHSPVKTSQHTDIFLGAVHNTVILILVVYIYLDSYPDSLLLFILIQ